jgi:hypothetical protein
VRWARGSYRRRHLSGHRHRGARRGSEPGSSPRQTGSPPRTTSSSSSPDRRGRDRRRGGGWYSLPHGVHDDGVDQDRTEHPQQFLTRLVPKPRALPASPGVAETRAWEDLTNGSGIFVPSWEMSGSEPCKYPRAESPGTEVSAGAHRLASASGSGGHHPAELGSPQPYACPRPSPKGGASRHRCWLLLRLRPGCA